MQREKGRPRNTMGKYMKLCGIEQHEMKKYRKIYEKLGDINKCRYTIYPLLLGRDTYSGLEKLCDMPNLTKFRNRSIFTLTMFFT